jgi:hypothetical protein
MSAAKQWIVDEARSLPALERRLNALAARGYEARHVLLLPRKRFVILAAQLTEIGEEYIVLPPAPRKRGRR